VYFGIIFFLVVLLDQLTKLWVVHHFILYESSEIIPGFFNLTYLTNTGAAFGILAGHPASWRQFFFIGVAGVALAAIFFLHKKISAESRWYTVSLAMIAGGAVGNLIDRVRLGSVVDFLEFYLSSYHWPAFNVADSAITVGVGIFLLVNFLQSKKRSKA
jgi:signal peptidase II